MTSTSIDAVTGARSSLAIKAPCRVAAISNITLSGEQTIDGVAVVSGDRVLVTAQSSGVDNGIYVADTGDWDRAPDCNGLRDLVNGTTVFVSGGTQSGYYYVSTTGTITIGTTSITWSGGRALFDAVGWDLINSATASNSATIDFTASGGGFDDTYDRYMIEFEDVKAQTDDAVLGLRVGTGATPTWQSGAAAYAWGLSNTGGSGVSGDGDVAASLTTKISLGRTGAGYGVGNAAGRSMSGVVEYVNPEDSSTYHLFNFRNAGVRSDGANMSHHGAGHYGATTPITGIRFLFSSGNIASGTFRLYGLRKS